MWSAIQPAFLALAALTLLLLFFPLLRRQGRAADRVESELALCRAQLEEVERDRTLGFVDPEAAQAARLEIQRRMLTLDRRRAELEQGWRTGSRAVAAVCALLVPVAAFALYKSIGRPDLPDLPLAARDLDAEPAEASEMPNVEAMVARLEARLAREPDDLEGWLMFARSNMVLGRYERAAEAFARARGLAPERPGIDAARGEALVMAAEGVVTPDARAAFERELSRHPEDPRARFYLALAREQAGELEAALSGYLDLGRSSAADAPWLPQLRERIETVARELGRDPAPLLAEVGAAAPQEPAAGARDGRIAEGLGKEGQELIAEMVDRLAARLAERPDDLEGWRMLARSYRVLGRNREAVAAYRHLAEKRPEDMRAQIDYALALVAVADPGAPLPEEAVAIFARAHERDPSQPEALFYLGLAAAQRGDAAQARRLWTQLLAHLPPDSPARAEVARRIAELGS